MNPPAGETTCAEGEGEGEGGVLDAIDVAAGADTGAGDSAAESPMKLAPHDVVMTAVGPIAVRRTPRAFGNESLPG